MNKNLEKMRRISAATIEIRLSLKQQEESNKSLRDRITPIWNDPESEKLVSLLSDNLLLGREKVKACQIALHELKKAFRNYNKRYDRSQRTRQ